jgi:hypothetical protein
MDTIIMKNRNTVQERNSRDTEEQNGGYGQHGKTVSIKHCFTVPRHEKLLFRRYGKSGVQQA